MNTGESHGSGGRVVRGAHVEALYPPTRLLRADALSAENDLATTRRWAEAERTRAQELVTRAEQEAERLVAEANAAADRLRAAAVEDARAQAHAELGTLLRNFEAELHTLDGRFGEEVQRTAFRFARAVLDVEFEVRPERIVDLVKRVLERAGSYRQVQVRVHPDDAPFLRAAADELSEDMQCAFSIQADDELPRRGVRVDTAMGSFWAGVDDQLKPLREHLGLAPEEDEA